ncbi:MAG: NAD-dependent epimerase/dehydratase family protein [Oligoflexia bacterium]|nr:NAD-dependent epimerase/dehydratase family protein [Oligoflexia bacterium]
MANVVVTGGAGFIGSHIVDQLLAAGHQVQVIDDLSSGSEANLAKGVRLHKLDIRSEQARKLVAEISPDFIVHTAAQISVRLSMEDPVFDAQVNVVGLVNLLHAFRGKRLPHVIFTSTGGAIYGEQDYHPADEAHPNRPTSVYGLAKKVGEMYLDFWSRELKLTYTALRLANVYGPRQNPHGEAGVVAIFCQRLLEGKVPVINGSGEQTRDFVYVEDVARAVKLVCDKRVSGTYNIGTGKETSVNTLYAAICAGLGLDIKAQHGAAKEGEQMRSSITAAAALKAFGWKPEVQLEQGVKRTAEWFRQAAKGGTKTH